MSWVQKLYDTYNTCENSIGNLEASSYLLPICHTTQQAQIEITINEKGDFINAHVVSKEASKTIIPATEDSAGRTRGTTPHPLCDKLQYVAGDYLLFGGDKQPFFQSSNKLFEKDEIKIEDKSIFILECETNKNQLIRELYNKKLSPLAFLNSLISISNLEYLLESNFGISKISNEQVTPEIIVRNKNLLIEVFKNSMRKTITYSYLLEKWSNSKFGNRKIQAVFKYISKKQVISDLVKSKVLFSQNNQLITEWKENNKPEIFKLLPGGKDNKGNNKSWQADSFIRWIVEIPNELESKLWRDTLIWKSWIDFNTNSIENKGFCSITGENSIITYNHPAKIRSDGDKAKLFSSNDKDGFTFRGRFSHSIEACSIGYKSSQKIHSALRWLIGKQGYINGSQVFVAWATSGNDIPDYYKDTLNLFNDETLIEEISSPISTAESYANTLNKFITGYTVKLRNTNNIVILGLDSASEGRLSVIFYRELTSSEFLERIKKWHETCSWWQEIGFDTKLKKAKSFIGAASPKGIAETAFGNLKGENKNKIVKATIERILPCIIDGGKIPIDIVVQCVQRVSNRIAYEKHWEWNQALGITCSIYKQHYYERGYSMSLEKDRNTRDYLFGRLLAVADGLESWALYESDEKRETNAARLMQRFSEQPNSTWKIIELSLSPYKARLKSGAYKYNELIDEIMCLFKTDDFVSNQKLSGEFLLGYHCQRRNLKPAKKENDSEIENSNESTEHSLGE